MERSGLKLIDAAESVAEIEPTTLQARYDKMRLLYGVLAIRTLGQIMLGSSNDNARLAAAKELARMDEPPEVIAQRLSSSEFANMTMEELEEYVARAESG